MRRLTHGGLLRRLKAEYPEESWQLQEPSLFWNIWIAYTRAWEALLAEWDAGELGTVQPHGRGSWPFAALPSVNRWSIRRGEARQRELVGMTTEAELPAEGWGDRVLR
eukprot:SAG31_NODE_975_length_10623_cov_7.244964_6_plen_108_part_00